MGKETTPATPKTTIEEELVTLISQQFSPAETIGEATDLKSTTDLIDEMEEISGVTPYMVTKAMKDAGFKLHYTGEGYVWMLKEL